MYSHWQMWRLVILLLVACNLAGINLLILNQSKNTKFSGHIITFLAFITTGIANFWMGGIASTFFSWYYVVITLAAILINWPGLMLYSILSTLMLFLLLSLNLHPIYELSSTQLLILNFVNRFFPLVVIVSSLYTLLRENTLYEKMLWEHNYLLQADKDKFHHLARYDTLTNLPNRSYFQTYIENLISSVDIKTHYITVFFMDLDGLKLINDRYGHNAGDSLLSQAGKRLQACFREEDFLARPGGDEFTAAISHFQDDPVPQTISQRIMQEFTKPFKINKQKIQSTISIGLATYPLNSTNAKELIALADQAMYSAKKSGGNTFRKSP